MATLCINLRCPHPVNPDGAVICRACGQPLLLQNRYRCLELLGQGGFGRTYRASDEGNNPPRDCVVKQTVAATSPVLQSPLNPAERRRRFHQEAEQLAILGQHPQIPQLLEVVDNQRGQFLVQQYVSGPTLAQVVQAHPLEEVEVRRVLEELLPVLQFVHNQGVIHRDIKPANIIVPATPHPLVLVDFGASKAIRDPAQLAQTGTVIGSAGYGAPEQALGKAVFASDLFSLGVTCLHGLTGLHPFDLYSVSEDAWVWQAFVTPPVSPGLAQVLDRLVSRRLPERYSCAQEVLTDLRWSAITSPDRPPQVAAGVTATGPRWPQRFVIDLGRVVANGVAVSPNGRAIAAPCADGTVGLWDCTNGELVHRFSKPWGPFGMGHRGQAIAVCFSLDGYSLFSAGQDNQLIQWSLADYGHSRRLHVPGWSMTVLAMAPHGPTLLVGTGDGQIHLWPIGQRAPARTLVHHQDRVTALALDGPGHVLASGSADQTIRLWHLPSGRLSHTLTAPKATLTALACHPEDGRLVSGDQAGRVQMWNPGQPEAAQLIAQLASSVTGLTLSPDGRWLAAGLEDGKVHLWALPGLVPLTPLSHAWAITGLAFTPDSHLLITTGADGTIRFWASQPVE